MAKRRLSDAVHAITAPQPRWFGGACRWQDSLYDRLRAELAGTVAVRRRQTHQSRAPCHTGILTLLCEIDLKVGSWEPDGKTTADRLHQLVDRGWRPQDVSTLDDYSGRIGAWVLAGTELLAETPKVFLRQPCPRCGARFTHRRDDAHELVRVRALKVSESGCRCLACGTPGRRRNFTGWQGCWAVIRCRRPLFRRAGPPEENPSGGPALRPRLARPSHARLRRTAPGQAAPCLPCLAAPDLATPGPATPRRWFSLARLPIRCRREPYSGPFLGSQAGTGVCTRGSGWFGCGACSCAHEIRVL